VKYVSTIEFRHTLYFNQKDQVSEVFNDKKLEEVLR